MNVTPQKSTFSSLDTIATTLTKIANGNRTLSVISNELKEIANDYDHPPPNQEGYSAHLFSIGRRAAAVADKLKAGNIVNDEIKSVVNDLNKLTPTIFDNAYKSSPNYNSNANVHYNTTPIPQPNFNSFSNSNGNVSNSNAKHSDEWQAGYAAGYNAGKGSVNGSNNRISKRVKRGGKRKTVRRSNRN